MLCCTKWSMPYFVFFNGGSISSVSLVIYTTCLNIVYCFLVSYFTQLLHSKQGYEKLQAGLLRRDPNNYLSRFTVFAIYLEHHALNGGRMIYDLR